MGDKFHITFTDNNPGFKHITGHAHVDTSSGDITFTDDMDRHITGHGQIEAGNTSGGCDDVAGSILATIVAFIFFVGFPLGVIIGWPVVFSQADEYPSEVFLMVIFAIITIVIAAKFSFMLGMVFFTLMIFLADIIIYQTRTFSLLAADIFGGPILSVIPCGIGALIRTKRHPHT